MAIVVKTIVEVRQGDRVAALQMVYDDVTLAIRTLRVRGRAARRVAFSILPSPEHGPSPRPHRSGVAQKRANAMVDLADDGYALETRVGFKEPLMPPRILIEATWEL